MVFLSEVFGIDSKEELTAAAVDDIDDCLGISLNLYPLNVNNLYISLIFPKSSFHLDSVHMPSFHPPISSKILDITGPGKGGGRSGNRRTSSFRNSLVEI